MAQVSFAYVLLVAVVFAAPFCGLLILLGMLTTKRQYTIRTGLLFVAYIALVISYYTSWGLSLMTHLLQL